MVFFNYFLFFFLLFFEPLVLVFSFVSLGLSSFCLGSSLEVFSFISVSFLSSFISSFLFSSESLFFAISASILL